MSFEEGLHRLLAEIILVSVPMELPRAPGTPSLERLRSQVDAATLMVELLIIVKLLARLVRSRYRDAILTLRVYDSSLKKLDLGWQPEYLARVG